MFVLMLLLLSSSVGSHPPPAALDYLTEMCLRLSLYEGLFTNGWHHHLVVKDQALLPDREPVLISDSAVPGFKINSQETNDGRKGKAV